MFFVALRQSAEAVLADVHCVVSDVLGVTWRERLGAQAAALGGVGRVGGREPEDTEQHERGVDARLVARAEPRGLRL